MGRVRDRPSAYPVTRPVAANERSRWSPRTGGGARVHRPPRLSALSHFKELAPERMFETVRDRVFPFIKSLGQTGDSDAGSTYTHHMKDALFMMPTAGVLANVVDQLDDIDMADRDTKGDIYEYMLGKIFEAPRNSQGPGAAWSSAPVASGWWSGAANSVPGR